MSSDFCIRCDKELSVYCGPCMDAMRDEAQACLAFERVTVAELKAEVHRLRKGLEGIREELLEEDCDCPPEWPRCASCRTRLSIRVLLKEGK